MACTGGGFREYDKGSRYVSFGMHICFFDLENPSHQALTNFTKKYIIASIGYDMHMMKVSGIFRRKSAAQIRMKVLYDGRKIHKIFKKRNRDR